MVRSIAILSIAAAAAAQTSAPAPAFEVASVKPTPPPRPGWRVFAFSDANSQLQISGTRVTARGTLTMLIAASYSLERFQVFQGPEFADNWANTELYDV